MASPELPDDKNDHAGKAEHDEAPLDPGAGPWMSASSVSRLVATESHSGGTTVVDPHVESAPNET